MSTATESSGPLSTSAALTEAGAPPFPVRRFSVEEYHKLCEGGFFDEDDRYELLEGWIVPQMTRNPPHQVSIELAVELLRPLLLDTGWHVRSQGSVETPDSVPEPDVAVVRGSIRDYIKRHPGPEDTAAAIEIAESSLARDRDTKKRMYARAGIPVYWIINLVDRVVEVCTDPTGPEESPSYRSTRVSLLDEAVGLVIGGREVGQVAVRDLLP